MAGFLSGESVHAGTSVGSSCISSTDKRGEELGRWYMSRKEIEEYSPSRRDGIDLKKETYLRKSYCTFLQDLGMRLKVSQLPTEVIFHFLIHSPDEFLKKPLGES
ncbi:cyclin-T1-5-like isoform X2 [Senna tora]|uniref:Cyclin-T1-5-like isoform X2 n=1 Tax=Senna tora TaxID=362788 RepID=A0A834XCT3_9FABA|nr:cyclin-T1-5-like isoform X2 [Senna tora]